MTYIQSKNGKTGIADKIAVTNAEGVSRFSAAAKWGRRTRTATAGEYGAQPFYPATSPATTAKGWVQSNSAPVAGDTVTINGTVVTAVASGATGNQFNIGANGVAQRNLFNMLVASTDPNLSACYYALGAGTGSGASTGRIIVVAKAAGAAGNSIALAVTGTNWSVSGATLTGGVSAEGLTPSTSPVVPTGVVEYQVTDSVLADGAVVGSDRVTVLGASNYPISLANLAPVRPVFTVTAGMSSESITHLFATDSTNVYVRFRAPAGAVPCMRVYINDRDALGGQDFRAPNDAGDWYLRLPFPDNSWKRIRVVLPAPGPAPFVVVTTRVRSVYVDPTAAVIPVAPRGPKVVVFTDSYGTAVNTASAYTWPCEMMNFLGWEDVTILAVGGTGVIAPGGYNGIPLASGAQGRPYLARMDDLPADSDIVVVTASGNDFNPSFAPTPQYGIYLREQYRETFRRIQEKCPSAEIVGVLANWISPSQITPEIATAVKAFTAACADVGAQCLNLTEMPLGEAQAYGYTARLVAPAAAGATSVVVDRRLPLGSTWAFEDGTRFVVNATTTVAPAYTVTLEPNGTIIRPEASGAAITRVGGSLMTGTGNSAAPVGTGTRDRYLSSDNVHVTPAGSTAIGYALANLYLDGGTR